MSATAVIETSDMKSLHQVFRDALDSAPQLVGKAPAGDGERSALVGTYYDNVLRLLHAHHNGEDELVWPKLLDRCAEQAELVKRVADQHQDVVALIGEAHEDIARWSASANEIDAERLLGTLDRLQTSLVRHLDDEEELVLPLCAQYITQSEWAELPAHGMQHFDGDKPWLIMGLVREQFDAEQLAGMEASMPPPVIEMWTNFGEGAYNGFMAQLRG